MKKILFWSLYFLLAAGLNAPSQANAADTSSSQKVSAAPDRADAPKLEAQIKKDKGQINRDKTTISNAKERQDKDRKMAYELRQAIIALGPDQPIPAAALLKDAISNENAAAQEQTIIDTHQQEVNQLWSEVQSLEDQLAALRAQLAHP